MKDAETPLGVENLSLTTPSSSAAFQWLARRFAVQKEREQAKQEEQQRPAGLRGERPRRREEGVRREECSGRNIVGVLRHRSTALSVGERYGESTDSSVTSDGQATNTPEACEGAAAKSQKTEGEPAD